MLSFGLRVLGERVVLERHGIDVSFCSNDMCRSRAGYGASSHFERILILLLGVVRLCAWALHNTCSREFSSLSIV